MNEKAKQILSDLNQGIQIANLGTSGSCEQTLGDAEIDDQGNFTGTITLKFTGPADSMIFTFGG
jgi:hypothetical protein